MLKCRCQFNVLLFLLCIFREEVRQMFEHAYSSYLEHAYPYDELRPLSCDGIDTWGRCVTLLILLLLLFILVSLLAHDNPLVILILLCKPSICSPYFQLFSHSD